MRRRLAHSWRPGEHVTLIGPKGAGKTHMALMLCDLSRHVLVLATKRRDPLLSGLRRHGYIIVPDVGGVLWSGDKKEPITKKVVVWPVFPEGTPEKKRLEMQAAVMRKTLAWADETGGWTVLVDETMWFTANLRLERELNAMWFQGRTQGLSVLACAQRPAHVPRLAFSQADYLFLWQIGDRRDVLNMREITTTLPGALIEDSLRQLDHERHECLFVDVHRGEIARVIADKRPT